MSENYTPEFNPDAKYHDKEWLREQIVENCRSAADVADECGVTGSNVRKIVREHGFKAKYKDHDWLKEAFNEQEMSPDEMADECGVSYTTITSWLGRAGVEWRTYGAKDE